MREMPDGTKIGRAPSDRQSWEIIAAYRHAWALAQFAPSGYLAKALANWQSVAQRELAQAFTRTPRRVYSTASERATGRLSVRGLPHFDQMTVGIADVAALLELVLFRQHQELSTPGAPSAYTASMSLTRILRKLLNPVGITRRLQDDRRLVVGRSSAAIDDDPAVG